jgi:hypothetical protein
MQQRPERVPGRGKDTLFERPDASVLLHRGRPELGRGRAHARRPLQLDSQHGVCVQGICALSSTPDTNCPDAAVLPYVDPFGAYCSDGGPVACALGYDVAFDGGLWPGPVESTPPNPCATSRTDGAAPADAGGGD